MELLRKMWKDNEGQDMVEYALLAGLISLAAIAVIPTAGTTIKSVWDNVSTALTSAAANK